MLSLLLLAPLSFAEENQVDSKEVLHVVEQSTLLQQMKLKLAQTEYRLHLLESNVEIAKVELDDLDDALDAAQEEVDAVQSRVDNKGTQIVNVNRQQEEKKMEIADLEQEEADLEMQMDDQKELVGELTALLYFKQDTYYDDGELNPFKVFASPDNVSETLQEMTYLDLVENENSNQIEELKTLGQDLKDVWNDLRVKRQELADLEIVLQEDLGTLDQQLADKIAYRDDLKTEQTLLVAMIGSADETEEKLTNDIEILKQNIALFEGNYEEAKSLLSPDQQTLIAKIEEDSKKQFSTDEAADFIELDWPVNPGKGLTAFFSDSEYFEAFGVQHRAVDIRIEDKSFIYAPADGVVHQVVFDPDSSNYAYIMVAHQKGVMTLYGHVSNVAVEPGEFVSRGQILGQTGGMPGEVGSGYRTTGAHLHMEVFQDGVRVDPLLYLPLAEVPEDSLPEAYKGLLSIQLEQKIRDIQETLTF